MPESRPDIKEHAPRIITVKILADKIDASIGPSGKNIRVLQEETSAKIDIEEKRHGVHRVHRWRRREDHAGNASLDLAKRLSLGTSTRQSRSHRGLRRVRRNPCLAWTGSSTFRNSLLSA
ncbi:MAG: hypothetical protein IPM31_13740 [Anaerolineae bacterium]|nr:hypothetical protein [Anaerolineae bacterium]